jgi:hypothetical protein
MKRPQSARSQTPPNPAPPQTKRSRGRRRTVAIALPVILGAAAAVSVGAAAYSRDGSHDSAPGKAAAAAAAPALIAKADALASDEGIRGRALGPEAVAAAGTATAKTPVLDASSLKPAAADAYRALRVDVGAMNVGHDPSGVSQTSLPLHITNIGPVARSFDITITARDGAGATITKDTGTAANLQPGQSAEVRVLDIVNDAMVDRLRAATFAVTDVFAY